MKGWGEKRKQWEKGHYNKWGKIKKNSYWMAVIKP